MATFRLSARALAPRGHPAARSAVVRAVPEPHDEPVREQSAESARAVPVPWRVVRRGLGVIEIEHCGVDVAHSVRFALSGAGMLGLSLPRTVHPGERVRVVVRGAQSGEAAGASDAMLVMRWFQPDGTELLWPIVLE